MYKLKYFYQATGIHHWWELPCQSPNNNLSVRERGKGPDFDACGKTPSERALWQETTSQLAKNPSEQAV